MQSARRKCSRCATRSRRSKTGGRRHPSGCRRLFLDNAPHERAFSTFHRPSDSNPSSALRPPPPCPIRHSSILPTATQPFPQPSNNHSNHNPTTTQPSFGSNPRTTRFRLNLPTSLISQLQPILINNSTSTTPRPRHNRPYPVLIKPFISPSYLNHQTKRRARQKCRVRRRVSDSRI